MNKSHRNLFSRQYKIKWWVFLVSSNSAIMCIPLSTGRLSDDNFFSFLFTFIVKCCVLFGNGFRELINFFYFFDWIFSVYFIKWFFGISILKKDPLQCLSIVQLFKRMQKTVLPLLLRLFAYYIFKVIIRFSFTYSNSRSVAASEIEAASLLFPVVIDRWLSDA